jgi:predicted lipoprotein with Yx(FWY)xxD motif
MAHQPLIAKFLKEQAMNRRFLIAALFVFVLVLLVAPLSAQDTLPDTVNVGGEAGGLGAYLVAPNGMTLYTLKLDALGASSCVDNCAAAWPPYTVESADSISVGDGIPGTLGTIERADGSLQVTYNDMPLYFWQNDAAPGDATGHNFRTVWQVVAPAAVYAHNTADQGILLVDGNGFTLYTFDNDQPGVSNCTGGCASAWPPVTVTDANALITATNLPGIFSTFVRDDGALHVAYNGRPLYTFANDGARGDTTGEGAGNVWFVAKP